MGDSRKYEDRRDYLTNAFYFGRIVTERFMPDCSFHEKSWLKNRVNSGKPASRWMREMVILSQARVL